MGLPDSHGESPVILMQSGRWVPIIFLLAGAGLLAQDPGLNQEYLTCRAEEVNGSIDGLQALAKWAEEHKLVLCARRAHENILRLNPDHAAARKGFAASPSSGYEEPTVRAEFDAKWKELLDQRKAGMERLLRWAYGKGWQKETSDAFVLIRKIESGLACRPLATEKTILDEVNRHRKSAGVPIVSNDRAMCSGAQKHAQYLVRNQGHPSTEGLGAHNEEPTLPGYTPEGAGAGKSGDIAYGPPEDSVTSWMASLYHRLPILNPSVKRIGSGVAEGGRAGYVSVLNLFEGLDRKSPPKTTLVRYPAKGQKGVDLKFGNEIPNPIPGGAKGAGYPVTLTFYDQSTITEVLASLTPKDGSPVPFWSSTPERPATSFPQQNTICLIPQSTLQPATEYKVDIRCLRDGKPVRESWSFTTK